MRVKELVAFIKEREAIRVKKEAGKPRPWTKDPILGKFRFCNVHREDDRVTRWLRNNWYPRFRGNPDMWFAAVVARLLNFPDSLDAVWPYILPFSPKHLAKVLHLRKDNGLKNFNAAYIVSTNGVAMDKVDYIVERVLKPLWADRKKLRPVEFEQLEFYHAYLMKYDGLGSFIAAQVVADLKYESPLDKAGDWESFAASGPGSRRGMNRLLGRELSAGWSERAWRDAMEDLKWAVDKLFIPKFHAQDLQNCLCEFDKYERARLGEGTPKQIYKERNDDR